MSRSDKSPRVAILGLGLMGNGMAHRLLQHDLLSAVYNRDPGKTVEFGSKGVRIGKTPAETAAGADIVVSMLADDRASRAVWLGTGGALDAARSGAVLIEASTLSPEWIAELAAAAVAKNCSLLDAPVTGSRMQAANGELRFLVGGTGEALELGRPALAAMGKTIEHVGPSGSGALLKLINNFLCGVQTASIAEALVVIERAGLDRDRSLELLMSGAPASPMIKTVLPRMTAPDFTPHFHLELMLKDLRYARAAGERYGVTLNTAIGAIEDFAHAESEGKNLQDASAVVASLRNITSGGTA